MGIPYIVSIVFGVIFLILLIACMVMKARIKKRDAALMANIEKTYLEEQPARMDYDFIEYDEETEKLLDSMKNKTIN